MKITLAKLVVGRFDCAIPKNALITFKDGASTCIPKTTPLALLDIRLTTKITEKATPNVISKKVHVRVSKGSKSFS